MRYSVWHYSPTIPCRNLRLHGPKVDYFDFSQLELLRLPHLHSLSRASSWLGLSLPIAWGSLLLMGMGLLQLGTSATPLRVVLGLLTVLAGFEIIYAAVESSTLVAALLSTINLSLALTGVYMLNMVLEEKT